MNILHVGHYDKFLPKHINFTNENFDSSDHFFLMMDKEKKVKHVQAKNVKYISHKALFSQIQLFYKADKIILHGLFEKRLLHLFFFNPWLIKKCYWMIWGGDLYNYMFNKNNKKKRTLEFFRRFVISRIPNFITSVVGDYENAVKWYNAEGRVHNCLLYHSNVFKPMDLKKNKEETINIMVGNSASLSNNHLEVLEELAKFKDKNIHIFSPLSYGKEEQKKKVMEMGEKVFGDKFTALVELMPLKEYLEFLSKIDIAIFNHKRQQAMGNTINLLGLGKKVFLDPNVSPFRLFNELGIKVFDINKLDLDQNFPKREENQKIVADYFSEKNLLSQWKAIYAD